MTCFLMNTTNFIAQLVQIVTKILQDHISDVARQFVNDVGVEGPKTTYNNKKIAFDICCFILEYIQFFDKVFTNIKQAGATIAGTKFQFCMSGLKVVGYVCDANRKHSNAVEQYKAQSLKIE